MTELKIEIKRRLYWLIYTTTTEGELQNYKLFLKKADNEDVTCSLFSINQWAWRVQGLLFIFLFNYKARDNANNKLQFTM